MTRGTKVGVCKNRQFYRFSVSKDFSLHSSALLKRRCYIIRYNALNIKILSFVTFSYSNSMLRHTLLSVAKRQVSRRSYAAATSAEKRALQQSQLAGDSSGSSKAATTAKAPPPPPPGNTESSSSMIPIALVGLAAAGGAAYYLDLFAMFQAEEDAALVEAATTPEGVLIVEEEAAQKEQKDDSALVETVSKKDATEKSEKDAPAAATEPSKSGSRVTTVQVPPKRAAGSTHSAKGSSSKWQSCRNGSTCLQRSLRCPCRQGARSCLPRKNVSNTPQGSPSTSCRVG